MFGILTDLLMPYHPFTRLMIFNIFWSSPWQILKRAHQSSGNTGPTSSPLDQSAVSLSKQTDIVHSEGCQLDSCDIVRYTDQCCIGLKGQSESFTIMDLLMLPRAFKNLGLPLFNSVAFPSLSLQWNRVFEFDIVFHTWTRWKKPVASLDSGKYILSAAIVLGSNIARALPTFCLEMPGWRFAAVTSAQDTYFLHISSLSLKLDAVNCMKLLHQLKWG